jgi:hypothetical protein
MVEDGALVCSRTDWRCIFRRRTSVASDRPDTSEIAMTVKVWISVVLLCAWLSVVSADSWAAEPRPYILMQEDLAELKLDFNQAVDQVRLVFIVGPT